MGSSPQKRGTAAGRTMIASAVGSLLDAFYMQYREPLRRQTSHSKGANWPSGGNQGAQAPDSRAAPVAGVVVAAIRSLRPDHRGVLLETCYRGRSVDEAAAVLGIPAARVRSQAFYALHALKLALEERGVAS
ncbi:MAG TPA: sigma factor-like helix-turn-helix DNA-binding protein [Streptosporangiaceae bacterium]|nr:sigma factor-like helix-turn-helix DNA-binding protein [Streptosporangiaceae bacterium]